MRFERMFFAGFYFHLPDFCVFAFYGVLGDKVACAPQRFTIPPEAMLTATYFHWEITIGSQHATFSYLQLLAILYFSFSRMSLDCFVSCRRFT